MDSKEAMFYLSLLSHDVRMVENLPKVAPRRLQRTPEQVAELKRLAEQKRERRAQKLKATKGE